MGNQRDAAGAGIREHGRWQGRRQSWIQQEVWQAAEEMRKEDLRGGGIQEDRERERESADEVEKWWEDRPERPLKCVQRRGEVDSRSTEQ